MSKKEDYQEAFLYEKKSLDIREKLFNENPKRWVDAYSLSVNNIAITYKYLNNFDDAQKMLETNTKERRLLYQNAEQRWADVYTQSLLNIFMFYILTENIQKSSHTIQEACQITKNLCDINPSRLSEGHIKALIIQGFNMYFHNNIEGCIGNEKKALVLAEKLYTEHHEKWFSIYLLTLCTLYASYKIQNNQDEITTTYIKIKEALSSTEDFHIKNWIDRHFSALLQKNIKEFKLLKLKIIDLLFAHKQSPYRWSDAFK